MFKLGFGNCKLFHRFGLVIRIFIIFLVLLVFIASPSWSTSPQRIISGMPSITEMLFALGLGDRIVGVTTNCNYPPEARQKEKIGGFFLNLEKVVSLKPDLIVMLEDAQKRDIKKFKDYGLPVYTINPHTVSEVMESLLKLGQATGREKEARVLVDRMARRLEDIKPKSWGLEFVLKRPRVLVIVGYNPLIVVGGGTFIDDIIKLAGAENIAERARGPYPQFSFEKLLEINPDYIIVAEGALRKSDIVKDKRWKNLDAIKNDRILFINADILSRPGPRVIEAVEEIAKFIRLK